MTLDGPARRAIFPTPIVPPRRAGPLGVGIMSGIFVNLEGKRERLPRRSTHRFCQPPSEANDYLIRFAPSIGRIIGRKGECGRWIVEWLSGQYREVSLESAEEGFLAMGEYVEARNLVERLRGIPAVLIKDFEKRDAALPQTSKGTTEPERANAARPDSSTLPAPPGSECADKVPEDSAELAYRLSALNRQIPELRKRTWPGDDPPELARMIARRDALAVKLATAQAPVVPADNPVHETPRLVKRAASSPLLADPGWIGGFRWLVVELLRVGREIVRHASMPGYRGMLIETQWKQWLDGLAVHIWKVVEDGRNGPPIRGYVLSFEVEGAYQLVCAALEEVASQDGPNEGMMIALEDAAKRLKGWQAPAETPAPQPDGDGGTIDRAKDQAPPPPLPTIDYKALVADLRKAGKGNQAKLVEYMADKTEADAEDVARHVHDDEKASDQAMWNNADRTTKSLALMGSRLSFRFASGKMYREISPT
jgi:hypothetical protein